MKLALLQSKQNELYNFIDSKKHWKVSEASRLQEEMLGQNYEMMHEAAAMKADMIITSEAINFAGNPGKVDGNYKEIIQRNQEDIIRKISNIAAEGNCWIIAGLYRADDKGNLRNSSFVWNNSGILKGVYDKVHLAGDEKDYLVSGNQYQVFDTPFGRIGVCICWDMQFPECARILSLMGADLIVCPTWGWEAIYGHARAYENGVYVAAAMAVPYWMDIEGLRNPSEVVSPCGEILMSADRKRQGVFLCGIDIRDCHSYRELRMRDRRAETYRTII